MALGAVLALGGGSAAIADDLSGFDMPSLTALTPSFYGVFPSFPENWSDLPVQIKLSESAGYNSNILSTPQLTGATLSPYGRPIGGWESTSTYGISTKGNWGSDQFFADATYGMDRYLNNDVLNQQRNSVDAGLNWNYTSKCSGKLVASEETASSLPGQQVGINVINSTTTIGFNETAKCIVSGEYAAIFNSGVNSSTNTATFNSGVNSSTNTATLDRFNNFQSVFVAAGMSYAVSDTNSLELLATITGTDYTNRQTALNSLGLLNNITYDEVNLTYTKNISPLLAVTASVGVVGTRDTYFSLNLPSGWEPQYSLSVTWSATPKLDLTAAVSRTVSPPTNIISNLEISEGGNFGVTYRATPKVTLAASVSASHATAAFSGPAVTAFGTTQNTNTYGGTASLAYAITPFLAANLSYQYTKSTYTQSNLVTPTSVVLLSLNFNPH